MSEEYGSLSEEEILLEIQHQLEAHPEIDATDLEFKFEEEQLIVSGGLQTDEELEGLVHILEVFMDPKDYTLDVEIVEAPDPEYEARRLLGRDEEEDEDEEELLEDDLEEFDEEEDADDEEDENEAEEDDLDDDKW